MDWRTGSDDWEAERRLLAEDEAYEREDDWREGDEWQEEALTDTERNR